MFEWLIKDALFWTVIGFGIFIVLFISSLFYQLWLKITKKY